jgi:hypothetical protein
LFAAPRTLSQRTTSFIASQCQGIHQMPLSRLIILIIAAHPVSRTLGKSVESLMNVFWKNLFDIHSVSSQHQAIFNCASFRICCFEPCDSHNLPRGQYIYKTLHLRCKTAIQVCADSADRKLVSKVDRQISAFSIMACL